jgi:hypothetical protein
VVKSINNITPDENGNVQLEIETDSGVKTVNNIEPDENGNITLYGLDNLLEE